MELKLKIEPFSGLLNPTGFRRARFLTPFEVVRGLFRRVANIPFIDDVVTVKHGSSPMSTDLHGHSVLGAGAFHVANGRTVGVMNQQAR